MIPTTARSHKARVHRPPRPFVVDHRYRFMDDGYRILEVATGRIFHNSTFRAPPMPLHG